MPLGHGITPGVRLPFGKSANEGKTLEELPSSYLQWLLEQDWFEEKYARFVDFVQQEWNWREETNNHFEDD